ncbi:Asp-tRNA(Asn)/Glu-tRNA(Gln) amidotransferase GatCAB subunit A [Candidatus Marinamargulisbacteria bacterium SCGC AAA071-K20]|nr:Asp-tRNA(Asn)/Glu-tRNA(Gln) amidotransferase GatCAB subunit A [Candidatus Marinamargulisbacteria bacterium SCGC AAA071-K20]
MKTAVQLSKELRAREITATSLIESTYKNIESTDDKINAYMTLLKERALEQAAQVDKQFDKGNELSPLAGIPIAIKDNICIKDTRTTCSSKMLENYISPITSGAAQRCLDAGIIPVGKANMDEFAMGSSTENSAYFTSKNPWDLDYTPGGSSGGSAATVAAGQVPLALGSDTGGSVRQPASFCGVVGAKPSYGRVSRYGLVAFASSLDQIGPVTRTVEDTAHLLNVICGHDKRDATSLDLEVPDFTATLNQDIKGLKFAIPNELMSDIISDDIKEKVMDALEVIKAQGATFDFVSMDSLKASIATYYILAPAEASANLSRFDGVRYTNRADDISNLKDMYTKTRGEGFGAEVKRRIILGTYVLSSGYYDAFYLKAQKARTLIKNDFNKIFDKYDAILSPTTPTTSFKFGEKDKDPIKLYMCDIATIPANMAGLPGMNVPCGFSNNGMPIGFQIVTKALDEATMLRIGHRYQQVTDFHLKNPEMNYV